MISRRRFLKESALGLASLAIQPFQAATSQMQFSVMEELGRVNVGMTEARMKPDADSAILTKVYEDAVVPWLREVVGRCPYRSNQRWVETPDGYIWAPYLQPVKNLPNKPVNRLPETSLGSGMWVEVTVPYVDLLLANPPARSPSLKRRSNPQALLLPGIVDRPDQGR